MSHYGQDKNRHHSAYDIFKVIFHNQNLHMLVKISLKFDLNGSIDNKPSVVWTMAWHWTGNMPLFEPMMLSLPTHTVGLVQRCIINALELLQCCPKSSIWPQLSYQLTKSKVILQKMNERPSEIWISTEYFRINHVYHGMWLYHEHIGVTKNGCHFADFQRRFFFVWKANWNLFPKDSIKISQHRYIEWLPAKEVTSHYLNW